MQKYENFIYVCTYKSVQKMSTPSMALSVCLRNALVSFWMLWATTFVVTRLYALHEAYVWEVGKRNDERWLLQQCLDPEFYANLKQHSDLCTEVRYVMLKF